MATIHLLRPADSVLKSAPAPQWLLLNGILGEKIFSKREEGEKGKHMLLILFTWPEVTSSSALLYNIESPAGFEDKCLICPPPEMHYIRRHQDAGNNNYRLLLTQYVITAVYVSDMQWVTTVTQISSHQHYSVHTQQLCRSYRRHIAFSNQKTNIRLINHAHVSTWSSVRV